MSSGYIVTQTLQIERLSLLLYISKVFLDVRQAFLLPVLPLFKEM
jgi:hypothetical protein